MFTPNLSHADSAKTSVAYDVKYIHTNSRGSKDLKVKIRCNFKTKTKRIYNLLLE